LLLEAAKIITTAVTAITGIFFICSSATPSF
jgi:hypothetical protein